MVLLNDICRWWIDTAAATSLLLLAVLVAVRLTRQPAQRVRMIQAGLAGCLIIAVCNAVPGLPRMSLMVVEPQPQATLADGFFEDAVAGATHADLRKAGARGTTVNGPVGGTDVGKVGGIASSRWVLQWRAWVACGAVAMGIYAAMQLAMARWLLRQWRKNSVRARRELAAFAEGVEVRVSGCVDRPCAFGVFRPVVFVPARMAGSPPTVLAPLVRHEVAHIRNRDAWTALLMGVTRVMLCASPVLVWVERDLRLAQEILADAEATGEADRVAYAEALLSLAKGGGRTPMLATAAWSSRGDLLRRMKVLLAEGMAVAPRCGRKFSLAAAGMAVVASSVLAAVSLSGTSEEAQLRATERKGILYLMESQEANGGWLTHFGPAPTALAVRALLNGGIDRENPVVRRAVGYVETTRQADGGFYVDHEPTYHTAIVLSMYAAMDTAEAKERVEAGRKFLQQSLARTNTPGAWYAKDRSMTRAGVFADPTERAADAVLETYGAITYAKWKSLVYAGLSAEDSRVKLGTKWIENNWTLEKHPGTGSPDGLYYYYLAAARTLKASGAKTLVTRQGEVDWREALRGQLRANQRADGSWTNEASGRWLEDQPELVTAYALLALQATK